MQSTTRSALAAGNARVTDRTTVAEGVLAVTLAAPGGGRLPDWTPGAHIDLVLPNGVTRQYSLCGDRWDAHHYRIAVLREPDGRGGSAFVHDDLAVGDVIGLGGPRNNFPLVPAERYLFVAGGIGITPLLPMIHQADMLGADWRLLYGGRRRASMAFLGELEAYGDRVQIAPQDEMGLLDLAAFLGEPRDDTRVYACGPAPLLTAVGTHTAGWTSHVVRTERFVARDDRAPARNTSFAVELARAGTTLIVRPGESIVDAARGAGVEILTSCRLGICGTCETAVLDGDPDHRDSLLDDSERQAGDRMFPCVSLSRGSRLVLDL